MATYYFRNVGTNWGDAANWSLTDGGGATGAVPLATDDVIFTNNSGNCTVNALNRVCRSLNFSTYTNTITMTFQITVSGNVTLGASMGIAGTSTLNINATATLTSNGKTWPNSLNLLGTSTIFTLADNWIITGSLTQNGTSNVLNNNGTTKTITVNGGLTINTSSLTGTANIIMGGTGTLSSTTSGFFLRNNLEINTLGTITFGTNFTYNTGTFTYTTGTIVSTGSTFNITVATTFVINAVGFTINTLNATANVIFSGTNGCTITTFSVRTTSAAITHTFQSLRTYNITTLRLAGATGFNVSIVASTPGSQAILTLGNTSNNYLLNVTDIDSSLGSAGFTSGGILTNATNWTSAAAALYYIGNTNYSGSNLWAGTSGGAAIPSITAPLATDPVVFDANSGNCTLNVAGVAASINFAGYTNTITFTNTLSVSGNITLGVNMIFAGGALLRYIGSANSTLTSNGKEVGVPFEIAAATNNHTITYADNWTFGENFTIQSGTAVILTFTGNTINCKKSLLTNNVGTRYISGTTSIIMIGTGSIGAAASANVNVGLNLTINTLGSYTFNSLNWGFLGSKTFTYTSGTITVTASTTLFLNTQATATNILNLNGIDFENITLNGGGSPTYTLTSNLKCKLLTHADNTTVVMNGNTLTLTSFSNTVTLNGFSGSTIFYFNCWSGNGSVNTYSLSMANIVIDISNGNTLFLGNGIGVAFGSGTITHLQGNLIPMNTSFNGTALNILPNVVFNNISNQYGVFFTLLSNITVRTLGAPNQFDNTGSAINGSGYSVTVLDSFIFVGSSFTGSAKIIIGGNTTIFTISYPFFLGVAIEFEINSPGVVTLSTTNSLGLLGIFSGTFRHVKGQVITRGSNISFPNGSTILGASRCNFDNVTVGASVTMDEFFSGTPQLPTKVTGSNSIINFRDGFEKIAKNVIVSSCIISRRGQLLILSKGSFRNNNIGIRYYNQSPNGVGSNLSTFVNDNLVGTQGFRKIDMLVGDPAYT